MAFNTDIHVLKSQYEKKLENAPNFDNLSQLIDIYLIDSKYQDAENLLLNFKITKLSNENLAEYYLLLARTYKYEIKNDLAVLNFNKSRKILFQIKNRDKILFFYTELLEFYRKTSDFERAFKLIDKLQKTYKIEDSKNDKLLNFFYNRYAAVLNERAKINESIPLSLKAIELAKKTNNHYAEAISYNELGFSYKNLLKNKTAIEFYDKAAKLWMNIGCHRDAVHAMYNKNIVISHNNLLPSTDQINLNLNLIRLIDSLKLNYPKSSIYSIIEFHLVIQKKWQLAYKYRLYADTASEREIVQANFKTLTELKEKYENEQLSERNQAIKKIAVERKEKLNLAETRFWFIFSFSICIVFLTSILYVLWRNNKKQNKILIEKNKQKTILIQEIHHRVKNNLQFVHSILLLQKNVDEISANETIDDISRRIDAMSLVHEMLYTENDKMEISVKEYISRLIKISKSFFKQEKNIEIKLEIDEINLPLEKLIALGIICSELLTNSVKHVLSRNQDLKFQIYISKNKGEIEMNVSDNGSEKISDSSNKRYQLGMTLIDVFTTQLNGKMFIDKSDGYRFNLKFKISPI
jgi:two-component sensor histidine kinase